MGRYLRDARHHAESIQYFHRHAGENGYKQSTYHYDELCGLMDRASRSKNDKNDAIVIVALKQSVEGLMKEMRKRKEDADSLD